MYFSAGRSVDYFDFCNRGHTGTRMAGFLGYGKFSLYKSRESIVYISEILSVSTLLMMMIFCIFFLSIP